MFENLIKENKIDNYIVQNNCWTNKCVIENRFKKWCMWIMNSQLKMSLEIQICDVFQFCKNTVFSTYNEISFFSYFFF